MKRLTSLISAFLLLGAALTASDTPVKLVGDALQDKEGKALKADEALQDKKLVALYFSASWCPPCRTFTPKLVDFYKKHDKDLAVILVPGDRSEAAQAQYMKQYKMPWMMMKWGSPQIRNMGQTFQVPYIPTLIILDSEGNIVSRDGVAEVSASPEKAWQKWMAKVQASKEA